MALTRVLLGHAVFFLRSGFAERPAVSHISLQTDSIDGSTVEEMADLSHRMGVYSRAAFEVLPSNGSSLIQKAEAGSPHSCTATDKIKPDTNAMQRAFKDAMEMGAEDVSRMEAQLGAPPFNEARKQVEDWIAGLPEESKPAAQQNWQKLQNEAAKRTGAPDSAIFGIVFKDLSSGQCCTSTMITLKLPHLENYQPVMDMTNILAGCNCLCGSFGTWKQNVEDLLSKNGFEVTPQDYAQVTARDGHTCNHILPKQDVEYEQLHVLADKYGSTVKLRAFIESAVEFRDLNCQGGHIASSLCAEKRMLNDAVEHFIKYQTAKHGSNDSGERLGIWHDSSTCKLNELIGPITHWGSSNGVQHLVPRVGQPVMDYQLRKLIDEEKIEPGRIETCIEEHGFWKEDVSTCGKDGGEVPFSEHTSEFGTAGVPKANEPVKPYQLLAVLKLCDPKWVNTKIRGQANANDGALAGARNLGEHIMRYQDYGKKPDDPHWVKGNGKCADNSIVKVAGPLSKAKEACLKDKTCCFLSATRAEADSGPWKRCKATDGGVEELFEIRRSTPDPSDILTIEVAMNFQGKLDRHPLVWKDRGNVDAETERIELMSGFFKSKCPAESVCECGCALSGNRCGDPFNGHRPKEGDLVTAEQAGIFYYYGVDITTDTNSSGIAGGSKYVEAGVHWKWKSAGLTWLATKRFDLPGAEVGSSGPAEEENVTPYQLHFLLQQAPELKNHGDIMEWLASQGEEGYVMRGSPGLKPCDTKQHPEESRDTAQLQDSEETPLILRSLNKDDPKASDAPMGNDEDWSHRADDVDQHGRISGNIENLDPHSGEKGHKIPKTHSYDELLKELQFTEKLRKEPVFAGEFPIYWEKGYRAWKLNQDVRQLENKYLKDLYITSNAASKIVKKEYDVDNRLTSNVTTIVENEKQAKGTAGQSDYWESALKPGASNSKLKYFTDWNHDSKMSQVHALHAYKEGGGPLLTDKEIDKDLAAGGKFAGTVTTVGEHEMHMMVNRRMTAMMAGERVRFKLSPHVATILSNGVLRKIQTTTSKDERQIKAQSAAIKDFPQHNGRFTEGERGSTERMALAAFEYILDDPPYKAKKKTNGQIDCDFSQNMAILSKFNHYLVDEGPGVKLANIVDSEDPTYWQIRPILQWNTDIDSIVEKIPEVHWLEVAGGTPVSGDVVQPGQIFLLLQHLEDNPKIPGLSKDRLNEFKPNLEGTLFQPPRGVDDSGAFTIRSVSQRLATGATGREYTQVPRALDEDKVGHWLSWSGSIDEDAASKGTAHLTASAAFGASEVWSIADDGYGGLAISAYRTYLFEDDARGNAVKKKNVVKTNLLDRNKIPILQGQGVHEPWMLLTKEGAPGCKITVELKSPPRTDEKSENLEQKYKTLLGSSFSEFEEFLHSIQPQDLEEANGIKSQKIYLRPSARLLDYVHLDKTRDRKGKLTVQALTNLKKFFEGPWQILEHGHGGVEVAFMEDKVIDGKTYKAGVNLKELRKSDGTVLWSTSGHIKDSDLADATEPAKNSLEKVIDDEMEPWKHAESLSGNSVQ